MNKYNTKILNYLDNIKHTPYNKIHVQDKPIMNELIEIIENIDRKHEPKQITQHKINKKYNTNKPLLYELYKKPEQTLKDFFIQHSKNEVSFCYMTHNKKLYDYIFNNNDTYMRILHELLYNDNFVSMDIQLCSEQNDMYVSHYEFRGWNVYIYGIDGYIQNDMLQKIFDIILIMETISIKVGKYTRGSKLIIFLTEQKKLLNKYLDFIAPVNTNTGACYSNNYVHVWRKEEIIKVLIHELSHYYHFDNEADKYTNKINKINDKLMKKYKYVGINYINESFAELFALIVHSVYIHIYVLKNTTIDTILNNELLFGYYQVCKINTYRNNKTKYITQYTNALSYYVYKCILVQNLENIFKDIHTLVDFIDGNNKYAIYKYLENSTINDRIIQKCEFEYKKASKMKFVHTTTRMTVYG